MAKMFELINTQTNNASPAIKYAAAMAAKTTPLHRMSPADMQAIKAAWSAWKKAKTQIEAKMLACIAQRIERTAWERSAF